MAAGASAGAAVCVGAVVVEVVVREAIFTSSVVSRITFFLGVAIESLPYAATATGAACMAGVAAMTEEEGESNVLPLGLAMPEAEGAS